MFKSKIVIDMHLFCETLCQVMDEYEVNVTEFAASMQMGYGGKTSLIIK